VNKELGGMWKEVIVALFEVLPLTLLGGTEKIYENLCRIADLCVEI
jgi:hypothetical protein